MPELRVYRSPWGAFPDVIIQTNMTTLQGGQNVWAKPGAQLICGVCYEDSEGETSVMLTTRQRCRRNGKEARGAANASN